MRYMHPVQATRVGVLGYRVWTISPLGDPIGFDLWPVAAGRFVFSRSGVTRLTASVAFSPSTVCRLRHHAAQVGSSLHVLSVNMFSCRVLQPVRGWDGNDGDNTVLGDVLPHQETGRSLALSYRGSQGGAVKVHTCVSTWIRL